MWKIIIEIILIFAAFFLPSYFVSVNTEQFTGDYLNTLILSYISYAIPQTLLLFYIIWIQNKNNLAKFGLIKINIKNIFTILVVYIGVFAIILPFIILLYLLPENIKESIKNNFELTISHAYQFPLVFVFCIVTGYREELFFRSYLLTRFSELNIMLPIAVIGSSFLFGMAHLYQGIFGVIGTFALGIYFSIIFVKIKNVHIIAWAHGLYNFTLFFLTLFNGS